MKLIYQKHVSMILMYSSESKFIVYDICHHRTLDIDFHVHRSDRFFTGYTKFLTVTTHRLKIFVVHFNIVKLIKSKLMHIVTLIMYGQHLKLFSEH